ncbi:uncharacterized protein LOC110027596 [Phalaenopsis equestris]|uniref:uncharacterized protein LOC110027596 n=1 Tax=Phalaenopsis equestris TaxID=78828 RepID=UPI0009E3A627|nr:uncharacterized protein LOC110027596 [Phalaenopsis equestris]
MESEIQTRARRFHLLQQFRLHFPYIGATAALLLLCYSSFYIPIPQKNPGDLLRHAAAILISPSFVFLLGNAIILLLLAESRQLSSSPESISSEFNYCDMPYPSPPHLEPTEELLFEEKKVCTEVNAFRRSQSEKFERVRKQPELRRAETEVLERGRRGALAHDRGESEGEEDADHFRRTIEEFIAKQQRFLREESLAVVSFSEGLADPYAVPTQK